MGRKALDLTGQKFGKWTATKRIKKSTPTKWQCECECGEQAEVQVSSLKNGTSTSCPECRVTAGRGCFGNQRGRREYVDFIEAIQYGARYGMHLCLEDKDALIPGGNNKAFQFACDCLDRSITGGSHAISIKKLFDHSWTDREMRRFRQCDHHADYIAHGIENSMDPDPPQHPSQAGRLLDEPYRFLEDRKGNDLDCFLEMGEKWERGLIVDERLDGRVCPGLFHIPSEQWVWHPDFDPLEWDRGFWKDMPKFWYFEKGDIVKARDERGLWIVDDLVEEQYILERIDSGELKYVDHITNLHLIYREI